MYCMHIICIRYTVYEYAFFDMAAVLYLFIIIINYLLYFPFFKISVDFLLLF